MSSDPNNTPVSESFRSVFRNTTGMPIDFIACEDAESSNIEPETPFCRAVQQIPGAREACRKCKTDLLKQAETNAVTVTCWAGFANTAVPIKVRGRRTGFIVTGEVPLSRLSRANLARLG